MARAPVGTTNLDKIIGKKNAPKKNKKKKKKKE
jgi:hypothetical protein